MFTSREREVHEYVGESRIDSVISGIRIQSLAGIERGRPWADLMDEGDRVVWGLMQQVISAAANPELYGVLALET